MKILNVLTLRGPNVWSRRTCLEAWVDLEDLADRPSNTLPGLYERLEAWLPGLVEHRCGVGERGGFLMRLRDGTYAGHILEHVTVELQNLAGMKVGFGKARETTTPGIYKVAVRYREEKVGHAALKAGFDLLQAAIHDRPCDVGAIVHELKELADRWCIGPSTTSIVEAAEARGIPFLRLSTGSLVQLGQGSRQRRIWTAETDRTGAIAEWIASDKDMTKQLLQACGVPTSGGRLVSDADDAWEAAQEVGLPAVVKPRDGNHGRGVFLDLSTEESVKESYAKARPEGSGVIVERFVPGNEHRLLVVGDRVVAATRGEMAWVVGDGASSVRHLVKTQIDSDPRRGSNESFPLGFIDLDDPVIRMDLARQGLDVESVPEEGRRVLVQRNGNLDFDETDEVHPDVAATVVLAAKAVGLDVAGIDLVAEDIGKPLRAQRGAIVEVNAGPGLLMHLNPAVGKPRPVGEAIVDSLFAPGETGRIPVASVTGTNGKTVVARLLAHLLREDGRHVGLACSDGFLLDGRVIERGDRADGPSARKVLMNPATEAAVLEAGAPGILREGLGFDKCDVAVVTGIGEADHLGRHYVDTAEAMFTVKRCPVDTVLPTGTAVLKADDPRVAEMASLSSGAVTFFTADPENAVLAAHRAAGARAVTLRAGAIVLCDGPTGTAIADLGSLSFALGGRVPFLVEDALAAAAAAWALGIAPGRIGAGLASFDGVSQIPGRFTVIEAIGATVVVDGFRNPDAADALAASLAAFPATRRTVLLAPPANRRPSDLAALGTRLGATFDRVLLCLETVEPSDGPLRTSLRRGISSGGRGTEIVEFADRNTAIEAAVEGLEPGDLVVVQADEFHPATTVECVRSVIGRRADRVA